MGREKLEIPLNGGTLELKIEFKFIPKEHEEKDAQQQLSFTLENHDKRILPATKSQKSLIANLSKRLRKDIDVETLSKKEASYLIQEMLAEIKSQASHR